jgi:ADP-ribose pyrophosphatase YjhB (NUDIX family)
VPGVHAPDGPAEQRPGRPAGQRPDGPAAQRSDEPLVACVGAVVHDAAGRLLLIRRGTEPGRGLWSLPGGRVEAGENSGAAVEREVLEETGLVVRAGAAVGRIRLPGPGVTFDVTDLACTLVDDDPRPVAGDDADDVLFADAAALDRLPCTPGLLDVLRGWGVALPTSG